MLTCMADKAASGMEMRPFALVTTQVSINAQPVGLFSPSKIVIRFVSAR